MISQDTFSLFKKDASSHFDWMVITLSGGVLLIVSFFCAWYFLGVTQESAKDVVLQINDAVVLDREAFEVAEKKFTERRDNLAKILLESEETVVYENDNQDVGNITEEPRVSLEDE